MSKKRRGRGNCALLDTALADAIKENEMAANSAPGGLKYSAGKRRMDLLPWDAIDQVADVLTRGAEKYGDRNWESGFAPGVLEAALLRHMSDHLQGEVLDRDNPEQTNLACVAANALFLLAFQCRGRDRC